MGNRHDSHVLIELREVLNGLLNVAFGLGVEIARGLRTPRAIVRAAPR